jgi:hypothetical protein
MERIHTMICRSILILAVTTLGATAVLAQSSKITVHRGSDTHTIEIDSQGNALAPEVRIERVHQGPAETATKANTGMLVTDVSGLADNEDKVFIKDTVEFLAVNAPNYRYTMKEAKEQGHLIPYRIYRGLTEKTSADWQTAVLRTTFSRFSSKANIIAYTVLPKSQSVPPPVSYSMRP